MSDSKQENKFSQRLFKTGLMEVPTDEFDGDYLPRKIVRRQWAVIAILVSVILIGSISISLYFVFRNDFKGLCCGDNVVGRVKNLKELSGLVASHRYPGIFYSIEDSQNNSTVYVIHMNGTLIGRINLENVEQQDFEDIALDPGTEEGREIIYVGDIGNNWDKHCRGINSPNKTLYMFSEPKMENYNSAGEITIPSSKVTTIILNDPGVSSSSICIENTKKDSEALFVDPISKAGYLIQKVKRKHITNNVSIFKFGLPSKPDGEIFPVDIKKVGEMPITEKPDPVTDPDKIDGLVHDPWPMQITAGDISRDGKIIVLRTYFGVRMWNRNTVSGETVESSLTSNKGRELTVCEEPQGESIAINHDSTGFFTISEEENKKAANTNIPIYHYLFE